MFYLIGSRFSFTMYKCKPICCVLIENSDQGSVNYFSHLKQITLIVQQQLKVGISKLCISKFPVLLNC